MLCGAVYLIVVFLFIPVPFSKYLTTGEGEFPHHEVGCISLHSTFYYRLVELLFKDKHTVLSILVLNNFVSCK